MEISGLMGKPLEQWDKSFYNHVGVGFELPNHFGKLTALENLRFWGFLTASVRDPMELLSRVAWKKMPTSESVNFPRA